MCRPFRWMWGLLPLAVLLAAAMFLRSESIEVDISKRAGQRLADDGQTWAGVTLDGRDAVLTGQAPSDDARQMAIESASRVFGLRLIADRSVLLPEDKPYRWSAQRDGNSLRLKGSVPSEEARARLVGAVRQTFPSLTVVDEMKLARGASTPWASGTAFGLSQLARLVSGTVSLSGADYTIEGRSSDLSNYRQVVGQFPAGLPSGLTLSRQAVLPPLLSPYPWSAELSGDKLTLTGAVPDEVTRKRVVDEAKSALPGKTVLDEMVPADGAGDAYLNGVKRGLLMLTRLTSGKASLTDASLSIAGIARDVAAYEAAMGDTTSLPAGIGKGAVAISPARISPYVTTATKGDNDVLLLEGYAPAPASRDAIIAAANALPGLRVADRLRIAEGVPQGFDWLRSLAFVMGELARLKGGKAEIIDGSLNIIGEAGTSDVYTQVRAALSANLPGGLKLAKQDITPPRLNTYVWSARRSSNEIILTGFVPSEDARKKVIESVSTVVRSSKIVDQMQVAAGAPANLLAGIAHGLAQLARLDPGEVAMKDTALSVIGHASDANAYDAVTAAMGALPGGLALGKLDVQRQPVRPYTMTLTRGADGTLTLSGHVPDDAVKAAITAAAAKAMPQTALTNNLLVAAGLPNGLDWAAAGGFGLDLLAKLKSGTVRLVDNAFSIEGIAADGSALTAAKAAIREPLAAGLKLDRAVIGLGTISPYVWDLARDDKGFVLTGYYPDEASHKSVLDRLKERAYGAAIEDRSMLAVGAPRSWLSGAMFAVDQLTRLVRGKANLTDSRLTINGEAVSVRAATEMQNFIRTRLPAGFSSEAAIKLADPGPPISAEACQKLMSDLLSHGRILFKTGSATVDGESLAVLDFLTFASRRCPQTALEISGHTDNVGEKASNLRLSQRRADAVVEYLRGSGIDAARLKGVGYGDAKPVDSNETDPGRANNRRIEFLVKP